MRSRFLATVVSTVLLLGFAAPSKAMTVDVAALYIEHFEIRLSAEILAVRIENGDIQSFVPPPPGELYVLGEHHGLLFSGDMDGSDGVIHYDIESAEAHGPPSTGTVNTSLETIDLGLSDWHITVHGEISGIPVFDGEDDLSGSDVATNTYDPNTHAFVYSWTDPGSVEGEFGTVPVHYDIRLSGTVIPSPVPLPAAVWLFGSGLVILVGFGRRLRS